MKEGRKKDDSIDKKMDKALDQANQLAARYAADQTNVRKKKSK